MSSELCKVVPYIEGKRQEDNTWTTHWHLPSFLQKPGSYKSQLFDGTWRCLGCLCSFDMPPTSYKEYMLDKCQSIMYKVEVGILGMEYHFVGILPWFYKVLHCSLLVDLIGEVFETKCSLKGSKWSFFSLCRCWRTADFIISMQPFLTIASFVSILNFA